MDTLKYNIQKFPFFISFDSNAKAVIDIQAFTTWLEQLQNVEFLLESDEIERQEAYKELEAGESLNLKEVLKEW